MKLRNKKTGEIVEVESLDVDSPTEGIVGIPSFDRKGSYNSLAELNEEWEDYEEPKEHFVITCDGKIITTAEEFTAIDECEEIGNYFETREEAELAVCKLKAWKRLRDGGITFKNWTINQTGTIDCFATWRDNIPPSRKNPTLLEDLDLLFGGEE